MKEQYPDEWVAVFKGELIAHAPTLTMLDVRLEKSGYAMHQVWLEYLDTGNDYIVL